MNFVLHHALARRDLGPGGGPIGAMLPDLWRMADKRARPARDPVTSDEPRLAAVLAGILHHSRADAAFHACPAFLDGEKWLAGELAGVGAPRLVLFAHVAWELCLDGALVTRDGPARAAAMRDDVTAAGNAVHHAARLHHAARGRDVPVDLEPRVTRMLREIPGGSWIEGYGRPEDLASRLDGIRSRVGLAPVDATQRPAFVAILQAALARADAALDAVLTLPLQSTSV